VKKRLLKELFATYLLFWLVVTSRQPVGTNVFERDWDVLVILDACRTDALREVQDEYEFLGEIEEMWSLGSTSKEWIEQTFTEEYAEEVANTAYITGNPFANVLLGERGRIDYGTTTGTWIERSDMAESLVRDRMLDADDVGHIEPLWGDTKNGEFSSSQKPEPITERTIEAGRTGDYDRIIAHYMQPHSPYFASSESYEELKEYESSPFEAMKQGETERVWNAYIDNLRYVLNSVEVLLQNIDGDVIITADHGELMGDHRMYYHMPGNPHPKLRKVPWAQTTATDRRSLEPDVVLDGTEGAQQVSEDQLKALGYL